MGIVRARDDSCNNAANEGPVVGRPVRHAIFRLVRGMDLRLHPCSVAPAEGHEKCRPNRPTPAGSSCNNALNGRLGPPDVVTGKMNWLSPHGLQVPFSPEHGLFVWTPLLLVAAGGLLWMAWPARAGSADGVDTRRIGLILCLMVITQIYVTGSIDSWTLAGAFGQRRFVGLTVVWVVGLAAALQAVRGFALRRALLTVCALSVWWNLGLMAQFGAGTMNRQRLELGKNVYNTFVVFPRQLPQLAYRYVFDRESFYAAPRR